MAGGKQRLLLAFVLLLGVGVLAAGWERVVGEPGPVALDYVVRMVDARAQVLEIEVNASELGRGDFVLGFSANAINRHAPAARFRVREATDADGRSHDIQRERGAWRVQGGGDALRIVYEVHLREGLPDGEYAAEAVSACDDNGARLLGNDIFLFPTRHEAASVRAHYELPPDWKLIHPFQTGEFEAQYPNLRALYYSVVAIGKLRTLTRVVEGCELVLAARGRFRFGDRDLMDTIADVAEAQIEFFGGVPRNRYVFVVDEHPHTEDPEQLHYFGLHFDASMSILLDPRTDRTRLQSEPAHIIAHEFFHNWNGELVSQHDYDMNWFIEGVTTYYAYRTTLDARMLDNGTYARDLHRQYQQNYLENDARQRYSLAKAGTVVLQDAKITRLLYAGGTLAALALDEEIGRVTRHRLSLDDLMRELVWRAHMSGQARWPLTRLELEQALLDLTGSDFAPWFARYIYGHDSLRLPEYVVREAR